jgi:enoyl-CoA hydratase/carnithine racemase
VVSDVVLTSIEGHVGVVTLNRPESRNALTMEMRELVTRALASFGVDPRVRVVILQAAPPAFCAGVDLSESSPNPGHVLTDAPVSVGAPFAAFPKPIFAAVDGAAAGGGFEIALACDFIIASTRAKFLLPEVRIGSLPGGGGTQRLPRALPRGVAARMLYTGDALEAADAFRNGLVTELVEPDELASRAMDLATRIASNAPLSLLAIKQCLTVADNAPLNAGLAVERGLWGQLTTSEDRAEGRVAFREKRPPDFTGR